MSPRSAARPVLELRQYTLHPGTRETLIRVFEDHFIEGQEACGMRIIGQFRDLDDPDRLVWLREFDDMDARARALEAFYTGPVWTAHADTANATMIDWRNVLLLKPASAESGFAFDAAQRTPLDSPAGGPSDAMSGDVSGAVSGAVSGDVSGDVSNELSDARSSERSGEVFVATIYALESPDVTAFAEWFRAAAVPSLARAGVCVLAQLVTESAPNSFPRLPVREGECVFVWFAAYPDRASHAAAVRALERQRAWHDETLPALRALTRGEPQRLVLSPTRRSWLTYRTAAARLAARVDC